MSDNLVKGISIALLIISMILVVTGGIVYIYNSNQSAAGKSADEIAAIASQRNNGMVVFFVGLGLFVLWVSVYIWRATRGGSTTLPGGLSADIKALKIVADINRLDDHLLRVPSLDLIQRRGNLVSVLSPLIDQTSIEPELTLVVQSQPALANSRGDQTTVTRIVNGLKAATSTLRTLIADIDPKEPSTPSRPSSYGSLYGGQQAVPTSYLPASNYSGYNRPYSSAGVTSAYGPPAWNSGTMQYPAAASYRPSSYYHH